MNKSIDARGQLLQNALSAEINAKIADWRALKGEITELATRYDEMTDDESFLESEYYQSQMQEIEKEFNAKQELYHSRAGILLAICMNPIYIN